MSGDWAQFVSYGGPVRREGILADKKRRYQEDPAYREAIKARARADYDPKPKRERRPRGPNKPRLFPLPGGGFTYLIGLGQLADKCGLSKQVLRRYEKDGVIPTNRLVDRGGRRWYSREFVEFLVPLLREQSNRREPLLVLASQVEQAWSKVSETGTIPILGEYGDGDGEEEGKRRVHDGASDAHCEDRRR